MKLTTKQNDTITVRKGKDKEGQFVELWTETVEVQALPVFKGQKLFILTPMEAERLGNALIKAAQPKQQKDAPTEAQEERRGAEG